VLASHQNTILRAFCNKLVWLNKGQIERVGPVDEVLAAYAEASRDAT
jgi:ABC-2 type transport system ATP-binding protein